MLIWGLRAFVAVSESIPYSARAFKQGVIGVGEMIEVDKTIVNELVKFIVPHTASSLVRGGGSFWKAKYHYSVIQKIFYELAESYYIRKWEVKPHTLRL